MRNKIIHILLLAIVLFSFEIRIFRITEPKRYYFDEVYHVVTAEAYAQNNREAYNPFASPPKAGTAYDWLHPPLAKLIQAGSIKLFGDGSFGWRLPSAIFGTGIVLSTFVLGALLFNPTVGIFAAATIAFENLTFVMSRITMNDVFITFFSIVAFIFAVLFVRKQERKYLIWTAMFSGLAWASKWTGLYSILAVSSLVIGNQLLIRKLRVDLLLLFLIPPIIYLAGYGQFWLQGHSIKEFIDLHKQIWWYQNRRDLAHGYGTTPLHCVPQGIDGPKTWCPWALDVRPVYFSYETYGEKAGYIYNLGNPLIFWAGIIAISYLIGKFIEEKRKEFFVILLGYFIFWIPWIFSPRILFLHHYLPSIPFLALATGYALYKIWDGKLKFLAILAILIFATVFFYFYPISSGYPVAPSSIDNYMWLKTWR